MDHLLIYNILMLKSEDGLVRIQGLGYLRNGADDYLDREEVAAIRDWLDQWLKAEKEKFDGRRAGLRSDES